MNRIGLLRREQHLTQAQLAQRLGVSRTLIVGYESGQVMVPTQRLEQLSQLFNVSTDYLLNRTNNRDVNATHSCNDIKQRIESVISEVMINDGHSFDGRMMDEKTKNVLVSSLKNSIELGKVMQNSDK